METKRLYTNATITIYGAVCAVLVANHIINQLSPWGHPSLVPGFNVMAGLCYPILCLWLGLLIRAWHKDPKWWIQLIVGAISLYFLYRYRHFAEIFWNRSYLYITMIGIGYLIPPKVLISSAENKGWISLVMIALSAFCYTALTVVKNRLLWGPIIPGHPDMELMMETVLVNAEPLMVIIFAFFVVQFSFSQISTTIGRNKWIRWTIFGLCAYLFFLVSFSALQYGSFYMISYVKYSPLLHLLVQPITVYLVYGIYRKRNEGKGDGESLSWKECFTL